MSALFLRTLLAIVIVLSPALASAEGLRVVARVNDDAVTDFDLSQRVLFAIRTTGLQDSPELRQRMAAQILRQMIDEKLQIQDAGSRSEEHTSELQSRQYLVCRLLLEKKIIVPSDTQYDRTDS